MSQHDQDKNNTPIVSDLDYQETPVTKQKEPSVFVEIVNFALIALIIVLPIRWFIAQPFIVSGASMENTFHNNEYLIVDQLNYRFNSPERGEVIIFRYPNDPSKFFIKRIIALPGETIYIDGSEVVVFNEENPDGLLLEEPYIASMENYTNQTTILGEDEYFVMGDNRDHSSDSRSWGALNKDKIIGRAFIRLFPPADFSILPGNYTNNQND